MATGPFFAAPVIQLYTVTYDANGGIGTAPTEADKAAGDTFLAAGNTFTAPSGKRFKEWNTAADGQGTGYAAGDTFTMPAANVTLYAVWEDIPMYTLTIQAGTGGSVDTTVNGSYAAGDLIPIAATADSNYSFSIWTSDNGGTFDNSSSASAVFTMPASNVIITAGFTEMGGTGTPTYIVTYDANGGSGTAPTEADKAAGDTFAAAANTFAAPIGKQFKEWNTATDGQGTGYAAGDTFTMPAANVTLYAIWENTLYTLSIQAGTGGSVDTTVNGSYAAGDIISIAATADSNYSFSIWTSDNGGTFDNSSSASAAFTMPASDVIITAGFTEIGGTGTPTYIVTYDANGGSGTAPTEADKAAGDTFFAAGNTFAAPSGKRFKEWNTAADGQGTGYDAGDTFTMPAANVILYAVWEDIPMYTLTIQAGTGGSVDTSVNGSYAAGDPIPIAATADSNYSFSIWTSDNGGTFDNSSSASAVFTMPAANIIITAGFTPTGNTGTLNPTPPAPATTYIVTYDANGGSGSHVVTGLTFNGKHSVLDRNNIGINYLDHTFTAWNTKADGSGTAHSPGESITVEGNMFLYAQWEKTPVELEKDEHIIYLLGYPDQSVRPDNPITRAEVSAVFFRLLKNMDKNQSLPQRFSDVSDGQWYSQYVNYLAHVGIVTGYQDGSFKPNQPITRAEFVVIVSRFHDLQSASTTSFLDVNDTHWAYEEICAVYACNWINGYPDNTFKPEQFITRAETAKIVNVQLDRMIDEDALSKIVNCYNDIDSSHWGYADIIEASFEHEHTRDEQGKEIWRSW